MAVEDRPACLAADADDNVMPEPFSVRLTIAALEDDADLALRTFAAEFVLDDLAEAPLLGKMIGWIGWAVTGDELVRAGDVVSADALTLAVAGAKLLDADADLIDDVLLLDRVEISPEHRGSGYFAAMLGALVRLLRFDERGCYVLTIPVHLGEASGPAPGLVRMLGEAGFSAGESPDVYWWKG